jgi:hypothetical protein
MCGTKGRFAVQGKRLSGGIDAASWRFGIGWKLTFLVEEISDEHFLLTVESPKVWMISFGVLSKCRDGSAIFPRVGGVVIDLVEGSNDKSLQDIYAHRVAEKLVGMLAVLRPGQLVVREAL